MNTVLTPEETAALRKLADRYGTVKAYEDKYGKRHILFGDEKPAENWKLLIIIKRNIEK